MSKNLIALAERCEAATGPDRELDARIECELHFGGDWDAKRQEGHAPSDFDAPNYTASIDAAMTLVPEGKSWRLGTYDAFRLMPEHGTYSAWLAGPFEGLATAPALALCAAALRARAAQEPTQ